MLASSFLQLTASLPYRHETGTDVPVLIREQIFPSVEPHLSLEMVNNVFFFFFFPTVEIFGFVACPEGENPFTVKGNLDSNNKYLMESPKC